MQLILATFLRYSDFKGRSRRREFAYFLTISLVAFILLLSSIGVSSTETGKASEASEVAPPAIAFIYFLWWIGSIVPWIALQVRRFHDQGRSGWLVTIHVAAYASLAFTNPIFFISLMALSICLMFLPGQLGTNRYGNDPREGLDHEKNENNNSEIEEMPIFEEAHIAKKPALENTNTSPNDKKHSIKKHLNPEILNKYNIIKKLDGRFTCGGYTFSSYAQAKSYAKRRTTPFEYQRIDAQKSHKTQTAAPKPHDATPAAHSSTSAQKSKPNKQGFWERVNARIVETQAERWIGSSEQLTAGGFTFQTDLVYFGKSREESWRGSPRNLIDPDLPVGTNYKEALDDLGYWPSYTHLNREQRRVYLEWLSQGRSDPKTPIGYIFLFFYGLERRLAKDRSAADAPAIMTELHRLLKIYGKNHSFRSYAAKLIDVGNILFGDVDENAALEPSLYKQSGWELPIALLMHLGRKVSSGDKIDANDALCWTLNHPMLHTRTPVSRCFDEFCDLWRHRFDALYPDGIKIREPKTRLKLSYHSASSEFNAQIQIGDLPDIGAVNGPLNKFDKLLEQCTNELDALSRFLGRSPQQAGTLLSSALLPEPLRSVHGSDAFNHSKAMLMDALDDDVVSNHNVGDLLTLFGVADPERKLYIKKLPEILDAMDFGFEPDRRYGPAPSIKEDIHLCLFQAKTGGAIAATRTEYIGARAMAEIAMLAAKSDKVIVDAELSSIAQDIANIPQLDMLDRQRLAAHVKALSLNPSKVSAASKRVKELQHSEREQVLASAVRAILADGRITPGEVRFMEGLYKVLGLPQDDVYSRLHNVSSTPQSESKVQPSSMKTSADLADDRSEDMDDLDEKRVARIRAETVAVSVLLASVFSENDATTDDSKGGDNESNIIKGRDTKGGGRKSSDFCFDGLDASHSNILLKLCDAPIEEEDFETLCRRVHLMPSGAIETINDWAFDALDDYAIEQAEIVHVQEYLLDQIRGMGKT